MGSTSLINADLRHDRFISLLSYTLVVIIIFCGVCLLWGTLDLRKNASDGNYFEKISLDLSQVGEVVLSSEVDVSLSRNQNCRFWNCVNLYRCGQGEHNRLSVYVYPLKDYTDKNNGKLVAGMTREYHQILETVVRSTYYTSNPNEACLFLPSIDLLNHNMVEPSSIANAFAAMSFWDSGENHILFNMISNISLSLERRVDVISERAMILGGGFDTWTYRDGFDVSVPVWSPGLQTFQPPNVDSDLPRDHKLIVAQLNILPEQMRILDSLAQDHPKDILLLKNCRDSETIERNIRCSAFSQSRYEYPRILSKGTFCLLSRSIRLGQPDLLEILANNCIPVIAVDNYVLPFTDVLDWSLFSIRIREAEMHSILKRLKAVSHSKIVELRRQSSWVYNQYFKDLKTITLTTLEILEGRIFPHRSRSLHQWNANDNNYVAFNPLYLPIIAPKAQGFTAVILTYDRVESLFMLIKKLALVPSLQSILVVWNNQKKTPPHLSTFPTINKPLKVIQTRANKLSNRFYPYTEIDTEAILTIDDDINMLTTDELDFGFEVWREFPDRIVGFPSRIHVWDNLTMSWRYESEWTNQISMVLTGAAFHHKFWSHMYTYSMPGYIKEWVDKHMNCEDIAMNFLVANVTNKPPIKVTPRKKFKCPECTNTEMLSADLNHMRVRSACIDKFSRIYGRIPLRSVEFRADPVLFKDNFPEKLKRFNNIGSL